jgi:hypothetical protein
MEEGEKAEGETMFQSTDDRTVESEQLEAASTVHTD